MTECQKEIARWEQARKYCDVVKSYCGKMSQANMVEEIKKVYALNCKSKFQFVDFNSTFGNKKLLYVKL